MLAPGNRDAGPGGSGGNFPPPTHPQLGSFGSVVPELWTINVVNFYFRLVLHVNLDPSEKSGPNPWSF